MIRTVILFLALSFLLLPSIFLAGCKQSVSSIDLSQSGYRDPVFANVQNARLLTKQQIYRCEHYSNELTQVASGELKFTQGHAELLKFTKQVCVKKIQGDDNWRGFKESWNALKRAISENKTSNFSERFYRENGFH